MTVIASQFGSFNALMNLKRAEREQNDVYGRISSGEKLQQSSDGIADYERSNSMRGEIKALREVRSTNFNAYSAAQLADSTLDEVVNTLYRALELAEWSASDVAGPDNGAAKQARDTEYQELLASLDQLNDNVRYNDKELFGPAGTAIVVNTDTQVNNASDQLTMTTQPFSAIALNLAGTDVLTKAGADAVLGLAKTAVENLGRQRGNLGALQRRLERNIDAINIEIEGKQAEESRIRDADVATESVNVTRLNIENRSNIAVLAQANLTTESVFQLLR